MDSFLRVRLINIKKDISNIHNALVSFYNSQLTQNDIKQYYEIKIKLLKLYQNVITLLNLLNKCNDNYIQTYSVFMKFEIDKINDNINNNTIINENEFDSSMEFLISIENNYNLIIDIINEYKNNNLF